MATPYQKLQPLQRPPKSTARINVDGKFWHKFVRPVQHQFPGAPSTLDFSPAEPHDLAVSASARVSIVAGRTRKVTRSITRFQGQAYSATYRPTDGKLLAAADDSGTVSVFDVATRANLRYMKGHKLPTKVVRWRYDGLAIFSGCDDKTVRIWDLPTSTCLNTYTGHTDYVRCGAPNPASPDLWASGSYDHTVKLWDARLPSSSSPVQSLDHGSPVEACLILPGGSILITAGQDTMRVWDLVSGRVLQSIVQHSKTVTCLTTDMDGSRLLSGSLDGHVKIFDVQTYQVVHSIKAFGPVLSVGLSPDKTCLAVGRADGSLSIRTRDAKDGLAEEAAVFKKPIFGGTTRHFQRGKNAVAGQGDFQVEVHKRQRLQPYDMSLKSFRYHEALDLALASKNPSAIVAVMEELLFRKGLRQALRGRGEDGVEPLLSFLARYITHPDYAPLLTKVADLTLGR